VKCTLQPQNKTETVSILYEKFKEFSYHPAASIQ